MARRRVGVTRLFDGQRLQELVATAERGVLDFALFDDTFSSSPRGTRRSAAAGRGLVASRLAPRSTGIGLVATVSTTHTEPFHVSRAIATIDHVSTGRAAWQVSWSTSEAEAALFGRKEAQDTADAVAEAEEAIEVVSRLWDSWEDDAEIRDVPSDRFIDRDKVHYVDYDGVRFAVKGPSITPRSPQAQPPWSSAGTPRRPSPSQGAAPTSCGCVPPARTRPGAARPGPGSGRRGGPQPRRRARPRGPLRRDRPGPGQRAGAPRPPRGPRGDHVGHRVAHARGHVPRPRRPRRGVVRRGAADGFTVRPSSLRTDLDALVDGVVPCSRRPVSSARPTGFDPAGHPGARPPRQPLRRRDRLRTSRHFPALMPAR
ncbi:LLM class flavin-dependent oxidoreductase [Oerskovia sp. M15]